MIQILEQIIKSKLNKIIIQEKLINLEARKGFIKHSSTQINFQKIGELI